MVHFKTEKYNAFEGFIGGGKSKEAMIRPVIYLLIFRFITLPNSNGAGS